VIEPPKTNDIDSDEEENSYALMLDLQNSCGHTPFFVAIIKDYLNLAPILLESQMSSVNC
jgi:uncharacterized protein YdgA (DUF945 family)